MNGGNELSPTHNFSDATFRALEIQITEIFSGFNYEFVSNQSPVKVKFTPGKWATIYCAIDLYFHRFSDRLPDTFLIPYKTLFEKIFKIINRPYYVA
jgi:hypothetical protein